MQTKIKTSIEIKNMRVSGNILEQVLILVQRSTKVGMSTQDLADIAAGELKRLGGKPVFLGYYDFPDVICISVNDEVIHGIPRASHILRDGDIVSIDFGVNYEGMITDAARTFVVGNTNSADKLLIRKTEEALLAGIDVVKSKTRVGDIASAVEAVLKNANLGIVKDYVGHGVGHHLHEEPNIPNYGRAGSGPILEAGMTIAIEPMATLGAGGVYVEADGWTVRTNDGSRAAHFEDTVLITDSGYEILTRSVE
jgi:methionyl aminopeptidase